MVTAFEDEDVVRAYQHRPPYSADVIAMLRALSGGAAGAVLDIGCGRGELARRLAPYVDRVDAVDRSATMIEAGRQAPGGDAPNLRWIVGQIEDVPLNPPYSLILGGRSLHWMAWEVIFPRFQDLLPPDGLLAIVDAKALPLPWRDELRAITARYSTDPGHQRDDMLAIWERAGWFTREGDQATPPVPFAQSIDDYLDSLHSLSRLARVRMGAAQAAAFDAEVRALVAPYLEDGMIVMEVAGRVTWGKPHRPAS